MESVNFHPVWKRLKQSIPRDNKDFKGGGGNNQETFQELCQIVVSRSCSIFAQQEPMLLMSRFPLQPRSTKP